MPVGQILNAVCVRLKHVPMKTFCVLLVALQSFILDAVIIKCYGDGTNYSQCLPCDRCYWWIVGDVLTIMGFVIGLTVSYRHLKYHKKFQQLSKNHINFGMPLSCIVWFVYSANVAARVIVIFQSGRINNSLKESEFIGPQFLKTGIALTAVVFILFTNSHHHANEGTKEKMMINAVATGVTFDILDTVDFLDILFVEETEVPLPYSIFHVVIAIAVINLFRPTFSFLVLTLNHFKASKVRLELSAANTLIDIFLINTPFMVVRMYMWHALYQDTSVFLIKNFIMIFIGLHELYEIGQERRKDSGPRSSIEMMPPNDLTHAHRPTDLRDRVDSRAGSTASGSPPEHTSLTHGPS